MARRNVLAEARRAGLTEGLMGGNTRWLVLGALAWGWRALTWALRSEERVVYRRRLRPGEQLLITERPAQPRRRRRKG